MKKTMYLAAGAVLVAAVSAFVYVNNGRNFMDDLFNANVKVLASQESDLEDEDWWVNDNDPGAIICTPGGDEACI